MTKIMKNQMIMLIKDPSFIRSCIYSIISALGLVMMTWALGNAMPDMFLDALSAMNEKGNINLGYIQFESIEQVNAMTTNNMFALAYASPFIVVIMSVFSVESYWKNCKNGYYQFLMSRRMSRKKIYLSQIGVASIINLSTYFLFGCVCFISSQFSFGFSGSWLMILGTLRQFIVIVAITAVFTFCICVFRKIVSTVIFAILVSIGAPALMEFITALFQNEKIKYLWIGTCATYTGDEIQIWGCIIVVSVLYIVISVLAGSYIISKQDM